MQARCHVPEHDRQDIPPRNRELPGMKKPAEILAAIALSLSLGVVHADVVEYDIYMTDSNAGRTVFERRDGAVSGNQQLAFNNRRSNRSEEHTSELQSLMRISYAGFCLNKKIQQQL